MTLSKAELEGSIKNSEIERRPTKPANFLMIGEDKYSVVG